MVCAWQLKVLAFKYERVSRISPVFYLDSAIALVLDIALFDATYTALQIVGLALVICMFAAMAIHACLNKNDPDGI